MANPRNLAESAVYHVARLGAACRCCGDATMEFLEAVPVPLPQPGQPPVPDGFSSPGEFYGRLEKDPSIPAEVLCANCRNAIVRDGVCPHQTGKVARGIPLPNAAPPAIRHAVDTIDRLLKSGDLTA